MDTPRQIQGSFASRRSLLRSCGRWTHATLAMLLSTQLLQLGVPRPARAQASGTSNGSTLRIDRGGTGVAQPGRGIVSPMANPFTGEAAFSYPIEVPEAAGSVEPQLALLYSSSRANARSWVGSGWSLETSQIARSLRNGVPKYDDNDTLQLDGVDLIRDPGDPNNFFTRSESFSRIRRSGAGFEVRSKDGTRRRYGVTANSQLHRCEDVTNCSVPPTVFAWLLTEVEDRNGNIALYSYDHDTMDLGYAFPKTIHYTLRRNAQGALQSASGQAFPDPAETTDRVVQFKLEPRSSPNPRNPGEMLPDNVFDLSSGFTRGLMQRLATVDVRAGGALLRRYRLNYARSRDSSTSMLTSVEQFGADANDASPRAPLVTRFEYQSNAGLAQPFGATDPQNTAQTADRFQLPANLRILLGDMRDTGTRLVDLNGDGRVDVIREVKVINAPENDASSNAYLGTASGFAAQPSPEFRLPFDTDGRRHAFVTIGNTADFAVIPRGTQMLDLTGDGKADVLHMKTERDVQPRGLDLRWDHDYLVRTGMSFTRAQRSAGSFLDFLGNPALNDTQGIVSPFIQNALRLNDVPTDLSFIADGNVQISELNGDGLPDILARGMLITEKDRSEHIGDFNYGLNRGGTAGFDRAPPGETLAAIPQNNARFFLAERGRLDRYSICALATTNMDNVTDRVAYKEPNGAFNFCFTIKYFLFVSAFLTQDDRGLRYIFREDVSLGKGQLDLNGDGLDDTLVSIQTEAPASAVNIALFNDGTNYRFRDITTPLPLVFFPANSRVSRDLGSRMADINGDGRIDFVIASPTQRKTFLGTGDQDRLFVEAPEWTVPAGFEFVNANGADTGVRIVDLNGDRLPDLIRSIEGAPQQVMLNQGVLPDLLQRVVNPLGGATRFAYGLSTDFSNNGGDSLPDLADAFPVVTGIVTEPGNGQPAIPQGFLYANGLRDDERREFRGFANVAVLDGLLRVTSTEFHQDEARQGLAKATEERDADGVLLSRTENLYPTDTTPPFLSLLQRTDEQEFDRAATPRRSRSSFSYDALGNLVSSTEFGEVDAQGVDLDPSDTLTTERDFLPAGAVTAPYLGEIAREVRERQGVTGGAILRRSRFFYDNDTTGTALPTRGNLTTLVAVLAETGKPDPTTRFSYDSFGNILTATSPRASAGQLPANEGVVRVEYDASGALVTARQQIVGGVAHREELDYAFPSACGSMLGVSPFRAAAGLPHLIRNPNTAGDPDSRRATLRCYDVFGRPIAERAPDGLASSLVIYNDTPGAISTLTLTRAIDNPPSQPLFAGFRGTLRQFDGLGRSLQASTNGSLGRIALQRTEYDAQGRVSAASDLRFDNEAERMARFTYDGLDRVASQTAPSATGQLRRTSITYDRGTTTTTDANGLKTIEKADPFGRVREVIEPDGSSTDRTRYAYDAAGRLTRVTDRGGNVTQIAYDGLGRRRTLTDPDSGVTSFVFDAADNLVTQTNAAGSVTQTFDSLNRLLTRTRSGDTNVDRFVYDTAPRGIGRLARRSDGTGSLDVLDYDRLGRATRERFRVANVNLDFTNTFDPLGQIIARRYPNGRVIARERDGMGFVTGVIHTGGRYASNVEFDAEGRLAVYRSGNGVTTRRTFDPATARLATIEVRNSAQVVLEALQYAYDAGDRVRGLGSTSGPFTFEYDSLDRLTLASGPYGTGLVPATLRYAYDRIGNMTCKDAGNPSNCAGTGGTPFVYPVSGPTTVRPHAATSINNVAATYTATGHLQTLGARRYDYDVEGRLTSASQNGAVISRLLFNAAGNLATRTELSGTTATSVRHLVARDFEWNQTTSRASIHVFIDGERIATQTDNFAPATSGTTTSGALRTQPKAGDDGPSQLGPRLPAGTPLAAMFALWLALLALWRARRPRELAQLRAATAATLAFVLLFGPALAQAAPSGNLNGDTRLDSADALRIQRMIDGTLPVDLTRGDVAPLRTGDGRIAENDLLLLLRATRGEDVDGDGLLSDAELAAGSSAFSADSDDDGLNDAQELTAHTNPNVRDTDGDGMLDGLEVTLGRDPLRADPADPGSANVVYYHTDQLGSSVLTTNSTGAVIDKLVYRPYGNTVPRSTGPVTPPEFGFTGQRFIAQLGIYDYGSRFYDPALGRFLQADAIVQSAFDPQTLNRYSYVQNNPVNLVDPTGNASFTSTNAPRGPSGGGRLCIAAGPGCNDFTLRPQEPLRVPTGPQVINFGGAVVAAAGGAENGFAKFAKALADLFSFESNPDKREDFPDGNTGAANDAQELLLDQVLYSKGGVTPEILAKNSPEDIDRVTDIVAGVASRRTKASDALEKQTTKVTEATETEFGGKVDVTIPGTLKPGPKPKGKGPKPKTEPQSPGSVSGTASRKSTKSSTTEVGPSSEALNRAALRAEQANRALQNLRSQRLDLVRERGGRVTAP